MARSSRMEGSATPNMDTSIPSRKTAPQSTASSAHARPVRRSVSAGGVAVRVLMRPDITCVCK